MNRYYYISFVFFFIMFLGCKKEEAFSIDNSFEFILEDTSGITISKDAVIKLSVRKLVDTKKGFTVEFKSDKGKLSAETIAFEEEYATTYLRLDEKENIYYLTAKIKDENAKLLTEKSIVYTPSSFKDGFDFLLSDTAGVQADGHSEIRLTVTGKKEKYENTIVAFTTAGKGNILMNEVAFEGNTATSFFKVPRIDGNTYITATVKTNDKVIATKTAIYKMDAALPSVIAMSGNVATYNLKDPLKLQIVLFDHNQTSNISEGLRVIFNAFQLSSSNTRIVVGNFANALDIRTNADGKLTDMTFIADSRVDTTKTIFIEANTLGKSGTITKTLEFGYYNK